MNVLLTSHVATLLILRQRYLLTIKPCSKVEASIWQWLVIALLHTKLVLPITTL